MSTLQEQWLRLLSTADEVAEASVTDAVAARELARRVLDFNAAMLSEGFSLLQPVTIGRDIRAVDEDVDRALMDRG